MDMLQFQGQPGQAQPDSSKTTSRGERDGARRATAVSPQEVTSRGPFSAEAPDPEVTESKKRRKFTAAYKLRILQEADQCEKNGQIGSLLRREGLYSSNLATWRRQREQRRLWPSNLGTIFSASSQSRCYVPFFLLLG